MSGFERKLLALGFTTYDDYLNSSHWKEFKRRYRAERPAACVICGATASVHFHHNTYERLGREVFSDMTILCGPHHDRVHGWLKLHKSGNVGATHKAIAAIQAGIDDQPPVIAERKPRGARNGRPRMNRAVGRLYGLLLRMKAFPWASERPDLFDDLQDLRESGRFDEITKRGAEAIKIDQERAATCPVRMMKQQRRKNRREARRHKVVAS